mgnify:CR=1 FL=1
MNCLALTRCIDFMRRRNFHSTKNIEWKDTKPYIPPVNSGLVIKVYDGDTITIATQIYNDKTLYRFSVRLNGIDCPEMKTNNNNEKTVAIMAKNRVIYQSDALYASKTVNSTGQADHEQLRRVQSANYSLNITRQDVNQFGELARIDSLILESPTVSFDMSYLLSDGFNEMAF